MELEVASFTGEVRQVSLKQDGHNHLVLRDLVAGVVEAFEIPGAAPRLEFATADGKAIRGRDSAALQQHFGLASGASLTFVLVETPWQWANAAGEPISAYRPVRGLSRLLEWIKEEEVEDRTWVEEEGHGIVRISPTTAFPETQEALLTFLAGAGGAHRPIIPDTDPCALSEEEVDWSRAPWRDIARLHTSAMPECVPVGRKPVDDEAATKALVCADEDDDVDWTALAADCTFYNVRLEDLRAGRSDYFAVEDVGVEDVGTPYLVLCANPTKRTIAFVYQYKIEEF